MIPEPIHITILATLIIIVFCILAFLIRLYILLRTLNNKVSECCSKFENCEIKELQNQLDFIFKNYYKLDTN